MSTPAALQSSDTHTHKHNHTHTHTHTITHTHTHTHTRTYAHTPFPFKILPEFFFLFAVESLPLETIALPPAGGLSDPWAQFRAFETVQLGHDPRLPANHA